MKSAARTILLYLALAAVLTALGLLSRRVGAIPDFIGDAIWAMLVYCLWRMLLPRKRRIAAALAALATAFAVEFSQLLKPDWLVRLRSTFPGHMILGQGFLWTDLIAYAGGVAVIFVITTAAGKLISKNRNDT